MGVWQCVSSMDLPDDGALRGKPRVVWLSLVARRFAIMQTYWTRWPIHPAVGASGFVGLVHRIANPVFLLVGFSDNQQSHLVIRVVD